MSERVDFSEQAVVEAMLDFEIALAKVEERVGVIPQGAAEAVLDAARTVDIEGLARDGLRAGTPVIPLVKMLAGRARFAHWGATSQDVSDTAMVLVLKRAQGGLRKDCDRLEIALRKMSDAHAGTVMLGRTLLQPAPPVTFGLKAAGWLGAVRRGAARVFGRFEEALVLEFGGASGTLAMLGGRGIEIGQALAEELGLRYPEAPWHVYHDRLAGFLCACGVMTGSLGKMARDISLMMQSEVGEAAEPGGEGRGGSSTMPHKRNPIACSMTLAAANRVPTMVAAYLAGMVQEHERGLGGWYAEWPTVAGIVEALGVAMASMAEAAEGLTVDAARMRANLEATRGAVFAEKALMLLAPTHGRAEAHRLIEEAVWKGEAEGRRLGEVLGLEGLETPEEYLGSAEEFRKRLNDWRS